MDCDARMLVRWKHTDDPFVDCTESSKSVVSKWMTSAISFALRSPTFRYRIVKDHAHFSLATAPRLNLVEQCQSFDIVNLHWAVSFVDLPSFLLTLPVKIPVVVTLHDMNYFTGGCHHAASCKKYRTICEACPALSSDRSSDLANKNFVTKKKVFESICPGRVRIVAPSRWLTQCAESSHLLSRFRVSTVPNGVDTNQFAPKEIDRFKTTHGIKNDEIVLLFVANRVNDKWKGIDLLLYALSNLNENNNVTLLVLGKASADQLDSGRINIRSLGYVKDAGNLATIYSAADLFVIPSRQDNLPNTVLESMACGTPAVGFAVGGIPDMIRDGKTGFLASPEDPNDLARAINRFIDLPKTDKYVMGKACRELVVSSFNA